MIFEMLTGFFVALIEKVGYLGIMFLMALESMIAPVPSESVMPFAGFLVADGKMSFWIALLASTTGTIIGSLISYYMGLWGGRPIVEKWGKYLLLSRKDLDMTDRWFNKHGGATIFFCRFVPVVRHLISIPAGMAKMKMGKFLLYTLAGGMIWNAILLYTGIILRENWGLIHRYSSVVDVFAVCAILGVAGWFIWRHVKK